tara:strand:+ start:35 stop:304 length:270 start_codon:yes stop_codon:yes gene_type:complete
MLLHNEIASNYRSEKMFLIQATKPLNDGTSGFRFNFFGVKGFVRKRKIKSNGFNRASGRTFNQLHMGKFTVAVQRKRVRGDDKLWHFAG